MDAEERRAAGRAPRRTLAWLLLALGGTALAHDEAGPFASDEKARIAVNLLRTDRGGPTRRLMSMGPGDYSAGDRLPSTVFGVGTESEGCDDEMTASVAEGSAAAMLGDHALVWTVDVEVVAVSTDRIVLDTAWRRLARGEDGQPSTLAAGSGAELTLREGERVLVDYADSVPSGDRLCAQSYAVELTAAMAEDPLARRQVAYELWLVHERPGGGQTSQYARLTAMQGEEAEFQFPRERLRVVAGGPTEAGAELQVDVKGTVRGRVRPDGSLDVSLGSRRQLRYRSAEGSGGVVGESGEKLVNLQPQETIRVDLPGAPRSTPQTERYARDLEGHSFALILRAKPLP